MGNMVKLIYLATWLWIKINNYRKFFSTKLGLDITDLSLQ